MENVELRKRIISSGLKYWQVAEAVGVSPGTLTIWLRKKLTYEQQARVEDALNRLTVGDMNG